MQRCVSGKPPELIFLCAWSDVGGSHYVRGRFRSPSSRGPTCHLSVHPCCPSQAVCSCCLRCKPIAYGPLPLGLVLMSEITQVPSEAMNSFTCGASWLPPSHTPVALHERTHWVTGKHTSPHLTALLCAIPRVFSPVHILSVNWCFCPVYNQVLRKASLFPSR